MIRSKLALALILPFFTAFKFSPMTQSIRLDQGQSKAKFEVENNTNEPIPVVISVVERIQLPDGSEELPKTDDLKAFPPQLIVPPKAKRSIRVDWRGDKKFATEKSYRVVAEQVPLKIGKKEDQDAGGIKMLLRYQSALYIDPGKTSSDLVVDKFENSNKLKIYLRNKGSAHQYLKNVRLAFTRGKKSFVVSEKDLAVLEGQNVLAGSTRVFELPRINGLEAGFTGKIEFDK